MFIDLDHNFNDLPLLSVQGKGRARAKPSLHVMMCETEEEMKYIDEICGYRGIEDSAIALCHEVVHGRMIRFRFES